MKYILLFVVIAAVYASSHSEAPGTASRPSADLSDFYMFQCYEPGQEDKTCFIMNAYPGQAPFAGPNYFTLSDDHFFEIYIDNNGDAQEDLTFQFFTGNRLGGSEMVEVPFESDEEDCAIYTRSAAPQPLTELKHRGLTINVGGVDVPIPLKFIGPIDEVYDSNLNWLEYYRLNVIRGDRTFGERQHVTRNGNSADMSDDNLQFPKPFDYAGTKTFPDYESYSRQHIHSISIPGCNAGDARMFVGQRAEAFAINLGKTFDLINYIPIPGFPGAVQQSEENDDLSEINVTSFALEVPTECILGASSERGVIGAWTAVRRLSHNGDDHVPGKQISRLGSPLVNEVVIGLRDKANFNRQEPSGDGEFLTYVTNPTFPAIVNVLFGEAVTGSPTGNIAPTNIPRNDLVAAFLTGIQGVNQPVNVVASEMLRLNTSIPLTPRDSQNEFGVIGGDNAGFPNGRRPGDDVLDIALRVVMGRLCHIDLGFCTPEQAPVGDVDLTDGAPINARMLQNRFPYLNVPHPGSGV